MFFVIIDAETIYEFSSSHPLFNWGFFSGIDS